MTPSSDPLWGLPRASIFFARKFLRRSMDCRVKPGNDDLKSAPMVRPLSCRGIGRPPQVKRNCLGGPPDHLDILRSELGKCPILALAPLNAGITSFANG